MTAQEAAARALYRAALELDAAAERLSVLPARARRRLPPELSADYLRNEAERARDTLHIYELLDI